ncbi:MAG TPA: dihydrodipicolinate synthase family protein [Bryobacteraceae bacterium]|jgi:dihydrodipicolinate synthase/N-acetylneuraminate lyase
MGVREKLRQGLVIPAHPLALTSERKLDERRQRALSRYYLASGSGGLAVGVHTTQFAIREPKVGMLRPVLELAASEMRGSDAVAVAGVCGLTRQAVSEAELAASLGYHAALVSLGALPGEPVAVLTEHVRQVAAILPVIGFYLQPNAGGRLLPFEFWRRLCGIENVVAIKIAPFNRYQTIDVVRAVTESGRAQEIALYTGNDDNIVIDLLTEFDLGSGPVRMAGGLLGHWAVWTKAGVDIFRRVKQAAAAGSPIPSEFLTLAQQITDANAAFFDPAHQFRGCIAGIHEILRRQGLLEGRWCLDPEEDLSPGQSEEIDRVHRLYPHLNDDAFVEQHRAEWLRA